MDFVDEHDGAGTGLDFLDHGLEALFKIAAVAGAGEQHAHVEHVDGAVLQNVGHFAIDDLAGEAFGDGGFAHAGIAHEERVVLLPAAEDLDGAVDFVFAANERIDLALGGFLVEVDAIGFKRIGIALLLGAAIGAFAFAAAGAGLLVLVNAAHGTGFIHPCPLGNAVGNVIHRVIAGHVLLLQEEGGMAFTLGKDGDQHIGAGYLLAAGGLHMDDGALDDALEAGGGL